MDITLDLRLLLKESDVPRFLASQDPCMRDTSRELHKQKTTTSNHFAEFSNLAILISISTRALLSEQSSATL